MSQENDKKATREKYPKVEDINYQEFSKELSANVKCTCSCTNGVSESLAKG